MTSASRRNIVPGASQRRFGLAIFAGLAQLSFWEVSVITMIFHITSATDWQAAQAADQYTASSLKSVGFIHCSEQDQVLEVANRLFLQAPDLLLLEILPEALGAEVRYENLEGGVEQYPHVYGPIPLSAVQRVWSLSRATDGDFILPPALRA